MTEFPQQVQNPFKVMLLWLKFEILDLDAILEAIEGSQVMKRLELQQKHQRAEDKRLIEQIMNGEKSLSTLFMTKKDKQQKITQLNVAIDRANEDIECYGLLHKILVL